MGGGTQTAPEGWEATLRIPWKDLGLDAPPPSGARWRFNLARTNGERRETAEWVPSLGTPDDEARRGLLRFR